MWDSDTRYGAWLSTNLCRNWEEALVMVKEDWPEAIKAKKQRASSAAEAKSVEESGKEDAVRANEAELFSIKLCRIPKTEVEGKEKEKASKDVGIATRQEVPDGLKGVGRWKRSGPKTKVEQVVPKVRSVGPSDYKNAYGEEVSLEIHGINKYPSIAQECSDEGLHEEERNLMAIVPYMGPVFTEVMNKLSGLGLKREAADDIGPDLIKRRRISVKEQEQKPVVSVYAANLRRIKAKMRRDAKKRERSCGDKGVEVEDGGDEVMKDLANTHLAEGVFTFKAGRGRRRKNVTEGAGGWPTTATKAL